MKTMFKVHDEVRAKVSVQRMKAGAGYTVVGVDKDRFGCVTYKLGTPEGTVITVINGHMLLELEQQ